MILDIRLLIYVAAGFLFWWILSRRSRIPPLVGNTWKISAVTKSKVADLGIFRFTGSIPGKVLLTRITAPGQTLVFDALGTESHVILSVKDSITDSIELFKESGKWVATDRSVILVPV